MQKPTQNERELLNFLDQQTRDKHFKSEKERKEFIKRTVKNIFILEGGRSFAGANKLRLPI